MCRKITHFQVGALPNRKTSVWVTRRSEPIRDWDTNILQLRAKAAKRWSEAIAFGWNVWSCRRQKRGASTHSNCAVCERDWDKTRKKIEHFEQQERKKLFHSHTRVCRYKAVSIIVSFESRSQMDWSRSVKAKIKICKTKKKRANNTRKLFRVCRVSIKVLSAIW